MVDDEHLLRLWWDGYICTYSVIDRKSFEAIEGSKKDQMCQTGSSTLRYKLESNSGNKRSRGGCQQDLAAIFLKLRLALQFLKL